MRVRLHVIAVALALGLTTSPVSYAQVAPRHEAVRLQVRPDGKATVVKGYVGGESHDSYVLVLEQGDELQVRLVSKGDRASFVISSDEFGEPVAFGASSDEGRRWVGRVPRAGTYYIAVVAHPSAHYSLRVGVRNAAAG